MTDNALAAFGAGTGLMSRDDLKDYFATAQAVAPQGGGGKQFLKISDKDGVWTFGAEETVVEDGALWAINPISFFHGYIAWNDGKPEHEHRQSIKRAQLPSVDSLPTVKSPKGYEQLYGFDLVCINGEDEGTLCEYKASSTGGKRAIGALISAIGDRFVGHPDSIVPVVTLKNNKYWDKKYKKDQYPPVFEIVEWRSMTDATPAPAPAEEPKKEEPASTGRVRTRPAAAPVQQQAPAAPPAETPMTEEEQQIAEEYAAAEAAQAPAEQAPRRRMRR